MVAQGLTIVIADDDPALRMLCRINLELEGYRVLEAGSAEEVERLLASESVDGLLLDIHLGPDDGTVLARRLHEHRPELGIAFFTGSIVQPGRLEALALDVLHKPFTLEDLSSTVRRLVGSGA